VSRTTPPGPAAAPDGGVTAILPLKHFHPRFLREAIGSLLGQTEPDWRLVVVVEPEDRERLGNVLAEALRDPRIRMLANEGYRYVGAFNTGIRRAETEFVAILLSDDMWAPHAVETLREAIRAFPEVDLFHSGRRVVDGAGRPISGVYAPVEHVTAAQFAVRSPVKHLICWRRRTALAFGGMDEKITTAGPDDYDFPWTMVEHGAVVRAVPECLYVYRDHVDGFRNTTHIPRSEHLRNLRYILAKHGVPRRLIRDRLRRSKHGYLKQCLYRNELHRRLMRFLGREPRREWREPDQ